jgi:hypothetical protein
MERLNSIRWTKVNNKCVVLYVINMNQENIYCLGLRPGDQSQTESVLAMADSDGEKKYSPPLDTTKSVICESIKPISKR